MRDIAFTDRRIEAIVGQDPVECRWPSGDAENPHTATGIMKRRQTERNRGQRTILSPEGEVPQQNLSVLLPWADVNGKEPGAESRFEVKMRDGNWRTFRVTVAELSSDQSHYCVLLDEYAP